jgi:Cu+-exporting ATPase
MANDPVCGMLVDEAEAESKGLSCEHHGERFYFCSPTCRLTFDEDPNRYAAPRPTAEP